MTAERDMTKHCMCCNPAPVKWHGLGPKPRVNGDVGGSEYIFFNIKDGALEIDYQAYSCDSSFEETTKINFCPMCGKSLQPNPESAA